MDQSIRVPEQMKSFGERDLEDLITPEEEVRKPKASTNRRLVVQDESK
jgi:hypothetical protein